MKYIIQCYVKNDETDKLYLPCGSSYSIFVRDLKTIRGIQNRITRGYYPIPKDTKHIKIVKEL